MILPIHHVLRTRLQTILTEHYGLDKLALPTIVIQYPPNRTLGDLAITVAFELARVLRKSPKVIAQELVNALGPLEGMERAESTANGYVNVYLDRSRHLKQGLVDTRPTVLAVHTAKTIVEHTAINPNKAAHVGHLRNSALGDTLVRLLRFQGHPVETQNYIDDTGVQVADVVVGFQELEAMSFDDIRQLAEEPRFDHYCWDLYARVTEWYEANASRLELRARALQDLEHGQNKRAKVARFVADRIVRLHLATMSRLNIEYDLLSWEGDILQLDFWNIAFDILKSAGAVSFQTTGKQAGCWVMPINDESADKTTDSDGLTKTFEADSSRNKVIVRSNGTVTYVGKDMAYQFWKFGLLDKDFYFRWFEKQQSGRFLWTTTTEATKPFEGSPPLPQFGHAKSVYNVIDTRQSYLQELLKQALVSINHPSEADHSVHFSYEMVALSRDTARALGYDVDKDAARPFVEVSGRKGLGVKADDLIDRVTAAACTEVSARNTELTPSASNAVAKIIATAAIRYFMIKYSRGKVITFDINEALSFEGESGPYLQYAAVRANNILEKLSAKNGTDEQTIIANLHDLAPSTLDDPDGTDLWALVLESSRLDEIVEQAVRTLELSILAKYAFGLAQAFNTFYHQYPVIKEKRRDVRLWRAAAVLYFRKQLTRALDLMGCEVPSRM